ncbi:hypothetical protein O0L34_g19060 [Tuta absoluta]|nr:hypothetical protein O0L34_g19060 [Tuta absoluta]
MSCGACNTHVDVMERLKCSGCGENYHIGCVGIEHKRFVAEVHDLERLWRCPDCKRESRNIRNDDTPASPVAGMMSSVFPILPDPIEASSATKEQGKPTVSNKCSLSNSYLNDSTINTSQTDVENNLENSFSFENITMTRGSNAINAKKIPATIPNQQDKIIACMREELQCIFTKNMDLLKKSLLDKFDLLNQRLTKLEGLIVSSDEIAEHKEKQFSVVNSDILEKLEGLHKKIDNVENTLVARELSTMRRKILRRRISLAKRNKVLKEIVKTKHLQKLMRIQKIRSI